MSTRYSDNAQAAVRMGPIPTARSGYASKIRLKLQTGWKRIGAISAPAACFAFLILVCAPGSAFAQAQTPPKALPAAPPTAPQAPPAEPGSSIAEEASPIPGDWAPELLYGIWNSSNADASEALYRAAFAAGPDVIPQLEAALKDDRTAEFAAQSLAFIGGNRALEILGGLANDPRDLGLKRFFYGALAEIDTPEATQVLLNAIANADAEHDRTVTEAAILALTVRSDATLISRLTELAAKAGDPVIRDDLENAADVMGARSKYLASAEGSSPDFSLDRAVRTYFIPALEVPAAPPSTPSPAHTARSAATHPAAKSEPEANVRLDQVTFSPDKLRALAAVSFTVPGAVAHYDMVLAKRSGNWQLASVWLGTEEETPGAVAK
jgi:hypothetical protein